ncbi:MAG: hypothetical protein MI757_12290 [Pirellulales bacterium]|nr:hypothetical protein [Pirellulales bacterium]
MIKAGFVEFTGDVPNRTCSFKVPKGTDVKAKLDEIAAGNKHIKDFSIQ